MAIGFHKDRSVKFSYTNYRGESAIRWAVPIKIWFGITEYHEEAQWIMTAYDLEKNQKRDFALTDCDFSVGEHVT